MTNYTPINSLHEESAPSKRRIRIAVALVYFSMGLCFSSWASRIPEIKSALHLNDALFGTILFALPVGQFLMMSFSGKLVTRFGSHKVLPYALPAYTIVLSSIGLVHAGWQLAIALFLFGLSGNLCNTPSIRRVWLPKNFTNALSWPLFMGDGALPDLRVHWLELP